MLARDEFDESWSEVHAEMSAPSFDVGDTAFDGRGGEFGEVT
jgi:hypothetical protein